MMRADLLVLAQRLFILNQALNFPLYYLPGFSSALGGDGAAAKFPCSISWMTRKGLPRLSTLILWNVGWYFLVRAVAASGDLWRLGFIVQMYTTGFVTVVLTPMMGPDVAMGSADALHCYSASLYVFDHWIANEFNLNVPLTSAYGAGFAVTASLCGVFQALRADDDRLARRVHARAGGFRGGSFDGFKRLLEVGFMLTENALFFIFLFGMSSGLPAADASASSTANAPPLIAPIDMAVVVAIVAVFTAVGLRRAPSAAGNEPTAGRLAAKVPDEPAPRSTMRRARSPARAVRRSSTGAKDNKERVASPQARSGPVRSSRRSS